MELAITGGTDSHTAASWGLINRVVADDQLDDAVRDLMARSIRGSAMAKGVASVPITPRSIWSSRRHMPTRWK